jgi:hypothetical protein
VDDLEAPLVDRSPDDAAELARNLEDEAQRPAVRDVAERVVEGEQARDLAPGQLLCEAVDRRFAKAGDGKLAFFHGAGSVYCHDPGGPVRRATYFIPRSL